MGKQIGHRWDISHKIIVAVAGDEEERIPHEQLEVALGHLQGQFLPMNSDDVLSLPTPEGEVVGLKITELDDMEIAVRAPGEDTRTIVWHGGLSTPWRRRLPTSEQFAFTPQDVQNLGPMPRTFESGGETFEVRWTDPERKGLNVIRSVTRGDETPVKDMWYYLICFIVKAWPVRPVHIV